MWAQSKAEPETSSSGELFTPSQLGKPTRNLVIQVAILAALVTLLYSGILRDLVRDWESDPNFSHGFVVPFFSAVVIWRKRRQLRHQNLQPSWSALLLIGAGLGTLVTGVLGAELFLSRVSFVFVLAGLVVLFGGWPVFRTVSFAWMVLFLMIPLPAILYDQIALPLQFFASKSATAFLWVLGVPAVREGNLIHLSGMSLEVAEACSGIRSLCSLGTLAIIYSYLLGASVWKRLVLALSTVPIAVITNALRITAAGALVRYGKATYARGLFHDFSGWLIFMVALALLVLVDHLFKAANWCGAKGTRAVA